MNLFIAKHLLMIKQSIDSWKNSPVMHYLYLSIVVLLHILKYLLILQSSMDHQAVKSMQRNLHIHTLLPVYLFSVPERGQECGWVQ